ncbi:MAG: sialidase family protein, partial [Reyranella sp.]
MRKLLLGLGLLLLGGTAAAQPHHAASSQEAFTATPAFGPDGTLWLVRANADRVVVVKSTDLGRTFSAPVAVTAEPMNLDWGPDARARIAVDPKGGVVVTFAIFQDKRFNGRAFSARSSDNGASFTRPQPLTADTTSQRFETAAIDPAGRVFAAWLDKRNVVPARATRRPYPGAALAYAWSDDGASFGKTNIALDNTCECCRLGIAFAGPGRPAI